MTYQIDTIDHVQLAAPVGGEDHAREFFHDLLGFEEIEKPKSLRKRGGVWFRYGTVHVHIGVENNFLPAKKAHPAFRVKNIEAMKTYLNSRNVMIKNDDKLPGANRFYLDDPFGNRLEFLEWME
ncbi:VOC family protein [Virgibacillus oceani]|uniref:Glyoxalase n=1 Tax=Virgibacillus oceani TaxID=1479511 RepID=A0A917HR38_9BACI|nr:VOC family protein [Virgibacillus oceani]GGG86414.1 glyoxalase [Virgibacillus oceani]